MSNLDLLVAVVSSVGASVATALRAKKAELTPKAIAILAGAAGAVAAVLTAIADRIA